MFKFESFGSGSSGNSYYICTEEGGIIIDAGIAVRKYQKALYEYGISLGKVAGILVTHNHVDHVRCLGLISNKHKLSVYLTKEVMEGIKENPVISKKPEPDLIKYIKKEEIFNILDLEITAMEVPHDSKDCVGYFIKHKDTTFCIITDCGQWTPTIEKYVSQTEYLVLESNYDPHMLATGPYPVFLQNRIRNGHGHLANNQAAEVISRHQHHLKKVWLCHLSEKNNTPQAALATAQEAIAGNENIKIIALPRTSPSSIYELE